MAKRAASEAQPQNVKMARIVPADEYSAVLALVSSASDLPEECRAMLQAMAPHCIGTPSAERHIFQEEMARVLSNVCSTVDSQRRAAVVAAEAHLAEAKVDVEVAELRLAGVEQQVSDLRAACECKSVSVKSAADGVVSAQQALSAEEKQVEALAGERACAEVEKEEYEGVLQDTVTRLLEGVKQSREREKLLRVLLDALRGLGVDRSLLDALPVALKTKGEARGVFAKLTITTAEEVLKKQVAFLSDKAEGFARDISERAEAVKCAQEALVVAQQAQSVALDVQVAAENALHEAETLRKEAAASVQTLKTEINRRSNVLDESRTESTRTSELFARFAELRNGPQDAPVATEMVGVTSAVAELAGEADATKISDKIDMPVVAATVQQAAEVAGA